MSATIVTAGQASGAASRKERSPAIYGIRGLAALALMTVHVAMFSGLLGTKAFGTPRPPSNFVGAFFVSGLPSFIGVFFVLPALFLYLPLAKAIISGRERPPQRTAFLRRLLRLLPAYYVLWLVVLIALNRHAITDVWYVLRPILLLQVYLPTPTRPNLINGMEITWTVPSMVQWYLALPLIAWASHRFAARAATPAARARRLMLPVPILIAVGVGWLFFVKGNGWDNRLVFWYPQGFAPTIGIGMALAIMLALSQVSPQDTPRLLRWAAAHPGRFWAAAGVVYLVNCARPFSVIGMDAIYSVSGLLVTYLMVALFGLFASLPLVTPGARPVPLVNLVLTSRLAVHLGKVSYGIYLWHFAVMHFYLQPGALFGEQARPIREFYGVAGFWELWLVTFLGSLTLATLSLVFIEEPVAAWGERFLRRREQRTRGEPDTTVTAPPVGWAPQTVLSPQDTATTGGELAATRDAIRANIVDLERSFGRQLLAGGSLTGGTAQRWDAANADLTALWEVFTAYSAVADEATRLLAGDRRPSGAQLAQLTYLLTGPSVHIVGTPPPLARRHITDSGRTRLTVDEAVQRMDALFRSVAELVTTVETVWHDVTTRLDQLGAELAEVKSRQPVHADQRLAAAVAEVEAALHEQLQQLNANPLGLWRDGQVDTSALDELAQRVRTLAAATGRAGGQADQTAA